MPIPQIDRFERTPLRRTDFPNWSDYYWSYQRRLVRDALVPILRGWGRWGEDLHILDVGCGDGGVACELGRWGHRVDGLDFETRRLEQGQERARREGWAVRLATADITDPTTLGAFTGPYDLVLFRDVLEHIARADLALQQARERLSPGGSILVVFPPYWSSFGGHQQILRQPRKLGLRWAKFPFAHWLPLSVFSALANPPGAEDPEWPELLKIRRCRLGIGALLRLADQADLRVAEAKHYLLRPSFRLRYGTPVVAAGPMGQIPLVREVLVSGSWMLLTRREAEGVNEQISSNADG
jgi:SAM-dependent methyltransferase